MELSVQLFSLYLLVMNAETILAAKTQHKNRHPKDLCSFFQSIGSEWSCSTLLPNPKPHCGGV